MNDRLSLPARFDSASVQAFTDRVQTLRGQSVDLGGARVTTAGALAIQALIATCRQWQEDAAAFDLTAPSDALLAACRLLGVPEQAIGVRPAEGETDAASQDPAPAPQEGDSACL